MQTRKVGKRSGLSVTEFCGECQGPFISHQWVSPVHFSHKPECSRANAIELTREADYRRLDLIGEHARKLTSVEKTLLEDRGLHVVAESGVTVTYSGLRLFGVFRD